VVLGRLEELMAGLRVGLVALELEVLAGWVELMELD
jgi:hypothetical protein